MQMNGLENIIVGLWFLPVTLYIIIPLTMLVSWLSYQAVRPMFMSRAAEESEQRADSALYSKA